MSREMKDSGIAWIGEIPKEWIRAKYRYSGVFTKGKLPNEQNIECLGKPIIGASEMLGKECRNFSLDTNVPTCQKQDVLILWDGANAGIVANNCDGIVSSTVVKYECTDENFDSQFLFYLFKNGEHFFKSKVNGTTIPHMNQKYIDEYLCIHPPLPEQQKIAEFLDRKCGEIDELVALQEKMIEELKAYKQSVITEAVTKGLNPNAPMKDSGIEWIGEIPEHWEVKRLKYLCHIQTGNKDTQDADDNGEYLFYVRSPFIERSTSYSFEGEGILMAGDGVGAGRVFHHAFGKYAVHQRVYRLSDIININSYYLFYYTSSLFNKIMDMGSAQSTVPSVRLPMLTNFIVCNPSLSEQQQIADYLDRKCAEIDELVAVKQQKIETLKEYKKSVIYEYVTGKKEVI